MALVDLVRDAAGESFQSKDGRPISLEFSPGMTEDELRTLESELPCPIPPDVRDLLKYCRGFTGFGPVDAVDFNDPDAFGHEAFPHPHPIATDGCGNFWIVDLLPNSTHWGPIYYACHDGPVILYQAATLADFLTELFKAGRPPFRSLIDDVYEDRLFHVEQNNPGVIEPAEALASSDPEIREFAEQLGPSFQIIDLRDAPIGMGFTWGRYGPRTEVRRHGDLPIWAYARPEQRPGLLKRLFGHR
jgi:cell wall assembly regulator SMI1